MITLKQTRANFPHYTKHEQIGSMQLFVCSQPADSTKPQAILVSYRTIVGFKDSTGVWTITTRRYSVTTTKQIRQFSRGKPVLWQDAPINL